MKPFGINGKHSALGRELDMAEFKGYVVAKLEEIGDSQKEMRADAERHSKEDDARFEAQSKRLGSLESTRAEYRGMSRGFMAIVSIVTAILTALAMKLLGL